MCTVSTWRRSAGRLKLPGAWASDIRFSAAERTGRSSPRRLRSPSSIWAENASIPWSCAISEAENAKLALEHLLGVVTEANHNRARLIRGVTHDVKNPLGAADGYAQLLEMELQGKLGDEQMAIVAGVRRSIRHALAIITDLLDVSRAESSGLSLRPERIDLAAIVSEAIEDHRGAAETAGHTLVHRCRLFSVAPGRNGRHAIAFRNASNGASR